VGAVWATHIVVTPNKSDALKAAPIRKFSREFFFITCVSLPPMQALGIGGTPAKVIENYLLQRGVSN
jgi:hypothetical protein